MTRFNFTEADEAMQRATLSSLDKKRAANRPPATWWVVLWVGFSLMGCILGCLMGCILGYLMGWMMCCIICCIVCHVDSVLVLCDMGVCCIM